MIYTKLFNRIVYGRSGPRSLSRCYPYRPQGPRGMEGRRILALGQGFVWCRRVTPPAWAGKGCGLVHNEGTSPVVSEVTASRVQQQSASSDREHPCSNRHRPLEGHAGNLQRTFSWGEHRKLGAFTPLARLAGVAPRLHHRGVAGGPRSGLWTQGEQHRSQEQRWASPVRTISGRITRRLS